MNRPAVPLLLVVLLLCALPIALTAAPPPALTFTRSFPGSTPDYIFIKLDRSGALRYAEAPHDDHPVLAQLDASEASAFFDLAAQLDFFKAPIESGLKVANTGKKTFRYDDGAGASTETTFNYSVIPAAQALLARFEQIALTEQAYIELDRTVHYDRLGVNDALAAIESLWLRKQLTAPQQFLPLLTRISSHEAFMHLVRDRAARLKDEFTGPAADVVAPN